MRIVATLAVALSLSLTASRAPAPRPSPPHVEIVEVPDGGIQPQAVVDADGTIHLIYFKGEPGGGDLFYVRQKIGDRLFARPIRVNTEPATAIATGSVRGGQLAVGRGGWVHVAWNGAHPIDDDGVTRTPMWYSRLPRGGTAFEAQRAIGSRTKYLDGGGSVAADFDGHVYVVWHAAGDAEGESSRRIYVASSTDDGARFGSEQSLAIDGGACGCCGIETLADAPARLQILYRAAGGGIHRDAMWLTVRPSGGPAPVRLQPWELPACPMTTFAMAAAEDGIVAAWETQQQIYTAVLDPSRGLVSAVTAMTGAGTRKHPSIAIDAAGDRLFAWTEDTAWARGGRVAWELRDRAGVTLASAANAGSVPVWGLVAAVARRDGSFVIVH
ncbi:MAG TPA: hypothetical protein VNC21_05935 [Vicinamibacterales bacterium]|nr:hypothetical protein [Vicinamibacterales bacterium]